MRFQQIMYVPNEDGLSGDIAAVLGVYRAVEARIAGEFGRPGISASSGLVVKGASVNRMLDVLVESIRRETQQVPKSCLGVDVAAEHLRHDGKYHLEGGQLSPDALLDVHLQRFASYPLVYFEDPFDAGDLDQWRKLLRARPSTVLIFGDDLFATDSSRIDRDLADGIVLKVNQTGTLSGTLQAARRARELGLALCVSHRSGETEDDFICDLATALGAAFIKLGGPRRGDRTARYNRLLRLSETWTGRAAILEKSRGEIEHEEDDTHEAVASG